MNGNILLTLILPLLGVFGLCVLIGRIDRGIGGTWKSGAQYALQVAMFFVPFAAFALTLRFILR